MQDMLTIAEGDRLLTAQRDADIDAAQAAQLAQVRQAQMARAAAATTAGNAGTSREEAAAIYTAYGGRAERNTGSSTASGSISEAPGLLTNLSNIGRAYLNDQIGFGDAVSMANGQIGGYGNVARDTLTGVANAGIRTVGTVISLIGPSPGESPFPELGYSGHTGQLGPDIAMFGPMVLGVMGARNAAAAEATAGEIAGASSLTKTLQLEEFIAPSTGKSIQAAVEGNAIVPIDKVSIYARGGVADVSEELRALQALKQSSRKEFDSNPANADRLDQLKSMQHNFDRSSEMGRQLENVGLTNTPANNNLLINHLLQTGQSVGPENRVWVPSLLEGPNGVLQVRSTWKIMSDDRAYLNTLMFVPIKK
jgi:hypothetical protein